MKWLIMLTDKYINKTIDKHQVFTSAKVTIQEELAQGGGRREADGSLSTAR